jgi:hypothetical protein
MAVVILTSQARSLAIFKRSAVAKYLMPSGGGLPSGLSRWEWMSAGISCGWQLSTRPVCPVVSRTGNRPESDQNRKRVNGIVTLLYPAVGLGLTRGPTAAPAAAHFAASPLTWPRRFKCPLRSEQPYPARQARRSCLRGPPPRPDCRPPRRPIPAHNRACGRFFGRRASGRDEREIAA